MSDTPTAETLAASHAAAFTGTRAWSAAEFETLLGDPHCFLTGDARSFALARVVLDEAELLTIATAPHCRRQGLAVNRMANWQAEAARRGARRAFLEVAADNHPAIQLYERCGYSHCGRRPGYYRRKTGSPVDAVLMERILP